VAVSLVHARIVPERRGAQPIPVLFNPTNYSLDKTNTLTETRSQGSSSPITSFSQGNARVLSLELFCDTYELRLDVRTFTDEIYRLLAIDPGEHRPPLCRFVWGKFVFRCMVERVAGRFTLFLPDGTPVRATLTVTFKEYRDPRLEASDPHRESADHTKTRAVKRGETLASIAAEEYGDPGAWRPIAVANGIDNPRRLVAAQVLVIPPLPERAGTR
jgi:hypothetical protein